MVDEAGQQHAADMEDHQRQHEIRQRLVHLAPDAVATGFAAQRPIVRSC